MRAFSVALGAFLCLSSVVTAQVPRKPFDREHPYKSPHAPALKDVPNEQEITYWTLEPGWHTEIELRNNIKDRDLTVSPTLRTADGSQYPLPPITIAANDLHILDLHQVLSLAAPQLVDRAGSFGSLSLLYSSPFNHNLYSGSMIHLEGTAIAFHFDGMQLDDVFNQGTREGIWWLPTNTSKGIVIISNTGLKPAEILVEAYGQAGNAAHASFHIGPRQTQQVSLRELLNSAGLSDSRGGLRVTIPAGAESVFAAEIVYDDTTGFSALMKTFERSEAQKVDNVILRAPMMALSHPDPALYFPPDTVLQPKIFLRNATHRKLEFSGKLRWRTQGNSGSVDLGTTQLGPDALTIIDVYQMQQDGRIPRDASWATPTISYNGRYGDLVAIVASYTADAKYGLQTPFNDMVASRWVGSRWFANPVQSSIITVGNASTEPARANLTLHYNQGKSKYEYEQSLQPGEQIWLDVAKVIQSQIPDKNGSVIPTTVESGTYTIRDLNQKASHTLFEGKLTIDRKFGHASYGCGNCCDYVGYWSLDPGTFNGLLGDYWQSMEWGYSSCSNDEADLTWSVYGWSSSNTSVVTVDSYGMGNAVGAGSATLSGYLYTPGPTFKCPYHTIQPVSYPVTVKPVLSGISPSRGAAGTTVSVTISGAGFGTSPTVNAPAGISVTVQGASNTSISATFVIPENPVAGNNIISITANGMQSNGKPFYVAVPDHLVALGDTWGPGGAPNSPCPPGSPTIYREVSYEVIAQDQAPLGTNHVWIQEAFENLTTNSCGNGNPTPGACSTAYTDNSATFTDQLSISQCNVTPASCGFNVTQHWKWCPPGGSVSTIGTPQAPSVIHADQITINGVATPNSIPLGTVINP